MDCHIIYLIKLDTGYLLVPITSNAEVIAYLSSFPQARIRTGMLCYTVLIFLLLQQEVNEHELAKSTGCERILRHLGSNADSLTVEAKPTVK